MSSAAGHDGPASSTATRPSVLIIGGLGTVLKSVTAALTYSVAGYIGRFLAAHIHAHSLASTLRLVDKQLPQLAQLSPEHAACIAAADFVQADASRPQSLARIFDLPAGQQFDYVFNCGGETRYSQEDQVYRARSHALSLAVGHEAARRKCKAFIELSTGQVYSPSASPRSEPDKLKPTTRQAKWKLQAEQDLAAIPGLPLVVLRLANVYGPYAARWLGTQLALARVHLHLNRPLKYLWSPSLRTNTVHVSDVARACWAAATYRASNPGSAMTFNVVDRGATDQAAMAGILAELFGIETGFQGTLVNTFARLNLERVVDEVNDDTLDPWAELCKTNGVEGSGPLSPFMEWEILRDEDLSLDGGLLERTLGFEYEHPRITKEECEAVVESYRRMKWWP